MTSMYDIQSKIANFFEEVDNGDFETDESMDDALAMMMEDLALQEADKADGIAYAIRKQNAAISFLAEEGKRIAAKKKAQENALLRLKQRTLQAFELAGITKVKGNSSTLSVKVTPSVLLTVDAKELPEEYQRVKMTVEADKVLIKEHLSAGVIIDGASIGYGQSLLVR